MGRAFVGLAALAVTALIVVEARASALGQFGPALAAEPTPSASAAASAVPTRQTFTAESALLAAGDVTGTESPVRPVAAVAATTAPDPTSAPTEAPTAVPTARPAATPIRTSAPVPAAATPVPPAAPTAATCSAGAWFCYPRLGIVGAIVPYTDCSGSTDVGTQIRSFACLSDRYLMAHAYTQFGKITAWRVGDVVFAYGQQFTVTGAFVQSSCTQPRLPLAPLEMQTSLTPNACGDVLVVTAR